MSIIRDSFYTGTGINFDSNEAESHAGAVLVDTESVFICNFCSFANNKAVTGGAVYVDRQSRTEISHSTFDRNIAEEKGSAFYISSKAPPKSLI